jgi:hypothetical protein
VILEGLVTTLGPDGALNVAPMGPKFDGDWSRFVLRPFRSSTTYRNLKDRGEGVMHVTDDVLLLARAAIGPVPDAETRPADVVRGRILLTSAHYHEFRVTDLDDRDERATIRVATVASGRLRDLFGLNRAKHAVVEAAIMATRVAFLPIAAIRDDLARLAPLVEKTGGPAEREAFERLRTFIEAEASRR